jgi:hypothetical protein
MTAILTKEVSVNVCVGKSFLQRKGDLCAPRVRPCCHINDGQDKSATLYMTQCCSVVKGMQNCIGKKSR